MIYRLDFQRLLVKLMAGMEKIMSANTNVSSGKRWYVVHAYSGFEKSVQRALEELRAFVYAGAHREVLARRREWFHHVADPTSVLWWVPAGHHPTPAEAEELAA